MNFRPGTGPRSGGRRGLVTLGAALVGAIVLLLLWTNLSAVRRSLSSGLERLEHTRENVHSQLSVANSKLRELEGKLVELGEEVKKLDEIKKSILAQSNRAGSESDMNDISATPEELDKLDVMERFKLERKLLRKEGEKRSKNPRRMALRKAKGVIVTAADTGYYHALINLIGSVHFWDPERNIVAFNLGMTAAELADIRSMDRVIVMESPIQRNLKNYAWKALCLKQATQLYGKTIWLDAGSDLRGDPVIIDKLLEKEDAFFVQGQDENMAPWAHPTTLSFFDTDKTKVFGKYSFSGNLQGYVYDSQAYWEVLLVVEKCCLIPECIAPSGSSLANHRYDQIAMSSAIYTSPWMTIIPHTELLAAQRDQLSPDHRTPSSHMVWSARGGTSDYVQYIKRNRVPFNAPTVKQLMGD